MTFSASTMITCAVLLLVTGCSQQSAVVRPEIQTAEIVWPQQPEPARIRFLYSITGPEDVNIKHGWFWNTLNFIKGNPQVRIESPYGITGDGEGRLYVVDTYHRAVHVFDTRNNDHYLFPDQNIKDFMSPIQVTLGTRGRIYIADSESGMVHVFTDHGKKYLTSIGAGELQRPTGLAVNIATGELLVLDTPASRIVVFDESDFSIKLSAGREGSGATGLYFPTHITVTGRGRIYVTDSLNFRIQELSSGLEFEGAFGAAGDSPGYFSRPKGVAADSDGNVYVADALFDNVQIFDDRGRLLLAFGGPGNGNGEFWLPYALYIDADDRIYVSDTSNRRVQVFQYLKPAGVQP